jgi:HPt (histidine-containing phosphotransfer) domain-containing protein
MQDWCADLDSTDVAALFARIPGEAQACVGALKAAIAAGDLAATRRSAHRLKGMAANLGAPRLAQAARGIECDSTTIEEAGGRMAALDETLRGTLAAIRLRA